MGQQSSAAEVLVHPAQIPTEITLKRVLLNCDFRCRDEGFTAQAIERIAESKGTDGKKKGAKWGRDWWARNIDGRPGHFVLFVNRAQTLLAVVGHGFYTQARFERKVDLGALKTAFLEAWGLELTVSQTLQQKYDKVHTIARAQEDTWWDLA